MVEMNIIISNTNDRNGTLINYTDLYTRYNDFVVAEFNGPVIL